MIRAAFNKFYSYCNRILSENSDHTLLLKGAAAGMALFVAVTALCCGLGQGKNNNEPKPLAGQVNSIDETKSGSSETEPVSSGEVLSEAESDGQDSSASEENSSVSEENTSVSAASSEPGSAISKSEASSDDKDIKSSSTETGEGSDGFLESESVTETDIKSSSDGSGNNGAATSPEPGNNPDNSTFTDEEDREEQIAALKAAIKLTEKLETYHIHTVTTITEATTTGETVSVTELNAHVVADKDDPVLFATGSVKAFEKSYPIEFYYCDGVIYQNIAGVKRGKVSSMESAMRNVSGSLWYPIKENIDTISCHDAGNNMTRYLINLISDDPSSRTYVETYVKTNGYVDSQHFVTQTITGDKAGSATDKWVSYTYVEGDFMPVFPDFSSYVME